MGQVGTKVRGTETETGMSVFPAIFVEISYLVRIDPYLFQICRVDQAYYGP